MIQRGMGRLRTASILAHVGLLAGCLAIGCGASMGTSSSPEAPPATVLDHRAGSSSAGPRDFDYTVVVENGDLMGGDAVRMVHAPLADAIAVLEQPDALWNVMPRVASMTLIQGAGDDQLIEIRHSVGPIEGGYTMRIVWQRLDAREATVWFWVDTSRPRDLKFAWGTFRLIPFGPRDTLLAYQVRIELFPGIVKWLFSGRILRAALTVPDRARALIESRAPLLPHR